jgi:N-methylhydantoinase A
VTVASPADPSPESTRQLPPALRLGIDVGGTFTDVVVDWPAGNVRTKVFSTPSAPAEGVLAACEAAAGLFASSVEGLLSRTERLALGTTAVTNLIATGTGRTVGLLTTRGFEDLVPLGRGYRRSEGGWLVPPPTIVPRNRIVGIDERCDRAGSVVRRVGDDEVAAATEHLVRECGVESLVVSFLWSFRNPANEVRAAALAAEAHPSMPVTAASQLSPVIREYERTQLALLNASVAGSLDWLEPLEEQLRGLGLRRRLLLTHSNGGVVGVPYATSVPVGLVQSGPAAGAAASSQLAGSLEEAGAVTCDMGGTSLDVALILGDTPLLRSRGRVMEQWTCLPMVDVDSVGAGGGSLAWADALGGLRVGPRSAGADPGPACYGRGGTEPTVTDALLVLGYLDPHRFLGGRMALDPDRAREACDRLGGALGLSSEEVAWGIREIALARMTKAVRNRLATRGLAASDLALVAFGGCGPLVGAEIADRVGTRRCVTPALASVFSAYGAATSPLRRQRSAAVVRPMPIADGELQALCEELSVQALADLDEGAAGTELRRVDLEADLRFERQSHELTVALHEVDPGSVTASHLSQRFVDEYSGRYGTAALSTGVRVELVTVRATAVAHSATTDGDGSSPDLDEASGAGKPPGGGTPDGRMVHIGRAATPTAVAVVQWASLQPGQRLSGPALVDAPDTTAWIPPGHVALRRPDESLSITRVDDRRTP